ncbi:hypothetical protein ACRTDU_12795 [Sunxiuqinia elliptica]
MKTAIVKYVHPERIFSQIFCFIASLFLILNIALTPEPSTLEVLFTSLLVPILLVQLLFQFPVLNWLLGISLMLISCYMVLAVWSEFSEFQTKTSAAWQLISFGWGLTFTGLTTALGILIQEGKGSQLQDSH